MGLDAMILVFWMLGFKPTFSFLPASWETCMQDQKKQLEPDMKHGLVQNQERSRRLYIVTLLI